MKQTLLFLCVLFSCGLAAQEMERTALSSGGDELSAGTMELSYTLGQLATTGLEQGNLNLNQGFQQGALMLVSTYNPERLAIELDIFPNPTAAEVTVRNTGKDALKGTLLNTTGQELQSRQLTGQDTRYDLSEFPAGTYLLQVSDEAGRLSTYRIQKF